MQRALLLDVVVRQGPPVFQLLPCKVQSLLVERNNFLVLDLCLHIVDGVTRLSCNFKRVAISTQDILHKNQILFTKHRYVQNNTRSPSTSLDIEHDGLACQCIDEDLHATTQAKHQVQRVLLLDVVVRQGPPVFQLLPCKVQSLLVGRNTFLVLHLCLHIVDGVTRLSSKFKRVAISTQDILHKNHYNPETAKSTQGAPPQASSSSVMVLPVNVLTKICITDRIVSLFTSQMNKLVSFSGLVHFKVPTSRGKPLTELPLPKALLQHREN